MGNEFLEKYQAFCKTVSSPFETREKEIMTWGLGICGEAGDLAGCIKKTVSHGNDQLPGIKENLGDVIWYAAMICNFYGWTLEDAIKENVDKLSKRYPNGFSWDAIQRGNTRVDWMEEKKAAGKK